MMTICRIYFLRALNRPLGRKKIWATSVKTQSYSFKIQTTIITRRQHPIWIWMKVDKTKIKHMTNRNWCMMKYIRSSNKKKRTNNETNRTTGVRSEKMHSQCGPFMSCAITVAGRPECVQSNIDHSHRYWKWFSCFHVVFLSCRAVYESHRIAIDASARTHRTKHGRNNSKFITIRRRTRKCALTHSNNKRGRER